MSTPDVQITSKLYLREVVSIIEDATKEVAKQAALRVEERTRINITENEQIDTGFMRASVFMVSADESSYPKAAAETQNISSRHQKDRSIGEEPSLPSGVLAGVGVGAHYAIYQENIQPFLAPAAEETASEFGTTAKKVFDEMVTDQATGIVISSGRQVIK